jgi:hypothetical protein
MGKEDPGVKCQVIQGLPAVLETQVHPLVVLAQVSGIVIVAE